jgi:hypothetical protein
MPRNLLELAGGGWDAIPIDRESTDAILAAGMVLEGAIKRRLSRSGGPSAPGESPAILTRELLGSIGHRIIRRKKSNRGDKVRVGTGLPQAPALEFGYVDGKRVLKPRPFMRPALDEVKSQMTSRVLAKMKARGVRETRNRRAERASRREFGP